MSNSSSASSLFYFEAVFSGLVGGIGGPAQVELS
jgi:hypothetical protein